ncbi:Cas10/Cmr2 second palm domain-containing protein [Streptomyces sp. NPDC002454]
MNDRFVYVDFGAVRIQHYLTRTPSLRGHRTASDALARATARSTIARVVGDLAEVNEEAGEADGVISLRFPHPTDRAPAKQVHEVQDLVLRHLRSALPGAEFHSVWGTGDSYLFVYAHRLQPRIRRGEVRHDLPPTAEFPLAAPCRMCHVDPAAGVERFPDGPLAVCPDCSQRNVGRGESAADDLTPEGRLRTALGVGAAPKTFTELAALGSAASGRNQLATVAVDGNAFGVFFAALAESSGQDPELTSSKSSVSAVLARATRTALEEAALELAPTQEHERLCVVPHVVGGDDVLVSLPADQAWHFTLTFLQRFGVRVRSATEPVLARLTQVHGTAPEPPTASAGVVFAHASHPLHLSVESAAQRLREAKQAFCGRQSSVQWLDVTADGPDAPPHAPLPLSLLREGDRSTATARALSRLAELPASHRARLAEGLREGGPMIAAMVADRVGHLPAVRPFLPSLDPPDRPPSSGVELGAALGLARWWPCG